MSALWRGAVGSSIRPTGGRPQGGLVDRQQDTTGDYGYDLAHEAAGRPRTPEQPRPEGEKPPVARRGDDGEDFSYDEAHDF